MNESKVLKFTKEDNLSETELINKILYARIRNEVDYVELDDFLYAWCAAKGIIINWNENHPGAIIYHSTIAGVPVKRKEK